MLKNTAGYLHVYAFSRLTDEAVPGDASNITCAAYINDSTIGDTIDDANPTEIGSGYYVFDLVAGETNGDAVLYNPVSTTDDVEVVVVGVYPKQRQTGDSFARIGSNGSGLSACATATGFSTHSAADIWTSGTRTLSGFSFTVSANLAQVLGTAINESTGGRIAGNFETFWDNSDATTSKVVDNVGGSGGDATEAKQDQIIGLVSNGVIATNSPVDPNTNEVTIIRNATYDGVAKPKLPFTVAKDYTGWTGTMTIKHRDTRAVLMTADVTVVSSTLLNVTLTSDETDFPLLTQDTEFGPHDYDLTMDDGSTAVDVIGPYIATIVRDVTGADS